MLGRLDQIHKHNIKVAPSVCANFGEPYRPFLYWLTNDLNLQTTTMMMLMTKVKVKVVSRTKPKKKVKVINSYNSFDWLVSTKQSINTQNFCLPSSNRCASFPYWEGSGCVHPGPGSHSRNYHHLLKTDVQVVESSITVAIMSFVCMLTK